MHTLQCPSYISKKSLTYTATCFCQPPRPLENNETESEILRASDAEPEAPLSPKPELKMDSISAAWLTVWLVSGAGLNFFFWVQPQGDGCTSETNEVCSFVNKFLQVPDVKNAFFSTCNALAEKHGGHVEVPVASACSGLGVAEMVFENLNTALSEMANLNSSKFSYLKAPLVLLLASAQKQNTTVRV